MKIFFNRRPTPGPWGGGTKVVSSIVDECLARGHEVFFEEDLFSKNKYDVLFCIDPRLSQSHSYYDLLAYRQANKVPLIQRVGDLGTHGKPELLLTLVETCHLPDHIIFPSEWAKTVLLEATQQTRGYQPPSLSVIKNEPNVLFVDAKVSANQTMTYPLRLVTHHWSDNQKKGFDTYQFLSDYSHDHSDFSKFTFIGRKPHNSIITNHIQPLDVTALTVELPKHSVYVTASKQEAGANHVLEAIALGLPVLYHSDGGSIPEYAKDFGIQYTSNSDIISILHNHLDDLMSRNNHEKRKHIRSSVDMAKCYVDLFESYKK